MEWCVVLFNLADSLVVLLNEFDILHSVHFAGLKLFYRVNTPWKLLVLLESFSLRVISLPVEVDQLFIVIFDSYELHMELLVDCRDFLVKRIFNVDYSLQLALTAFVNKLSYLGELFWENFYAFSVAYILGYFSVLLKQRGLELGRLLIN